MEAIQQMESAPFSRQKGDIYDRMRRMSHTASLNESERIGYTLYLIHLNDGLLDLENSFAEGVAKGETRGRAEKMGNGF